MVSVASCLSVTILISVCSRPPILSLDSFNVSTTKVRCNEFFLGCPLTYRSQRVLLFFVIPIKLKHFVLGACVAEPILYLTVPGWIFDTPSHVGGIVAGFLAWRFRIRPKLMRWGLYFFNWNAHCTPSHVQDIIFMLYGHEIHINVKCEWNAP